MEGKKTMKALALVEYGKLEYKDIPIPEVSKNQILVKVAFGAINPSDLGAVYGRYPGASIELGKALGFEGSGEVVAVGEDLKVQHKIGDLVCIITVGVWAEYALVESHKADKILEGNSLQEATCHIVNPGTVLCMIDLLKKQNKTSVIHTAGSSALGKMLIKACKLEGIKTINVVRNKKYFNELTEIGSYCNLDSTDKNFVYDLGKITKELNTTVCFEAVAGELPNIVLSAMPNGSTLYSYGSLSTKPITHIIRWIIS